MFPVKFTMEKWGFAAGMFAELCMVDFQWLRLRAHFIERIKVKSCWQWGTVSWLLIKLLVSFASLKSSPSPLHESKWLIWHLTHTWIARYLACMALSYMFQATLNLSSVMKKKIPACGFGPQNRNGGNSGRMLAFAKTRTESRSRCTQPLRERRKDWRLQTPFVPPNLPSTTNTELNMHVRLPHAACAEHENKNMTELICFKKVSQTPTFLKRIYFDLLKWNRLIHHYIDRYRAFPRSVGCWSWRHVYEDKRSYTLTYANFFFVWRSQTACPRVQGSGVPGYWLTHDCSGNTEIFTQSGTFVSVRRDLPVDCSQSSIFP